MSSDNLAKPVGKNPEFSVIWTRAIDFLVVFASVLFVVVRNDSLIFIMLLFLLCSLLAIARFSLFSLSSILVFLPYVGLYSQVTQGTSYGVLELGVVPNHLRELSLCILFFIGSELLWSVHSRYLECERLLLCTPDNIVTKLSSVLCIVISIFSVFIAFPVAPFSRGFVNNTHTALLPGNAWNHLAIVGLIFALPRWRESKFVRVGTLITVSWFLLHFERVDIVGWFAGLIIIYFVRSKSNNKFAHFLLLSGLCFIFALFMTFLGELRSLRETSLSNLVYKVFIQSTACDVAYIFNLSVEQASTGLLHGATYISYLFDAFPLVKSPLNTVDILSSIGFYPGGEFLFSEPLINFGLCGVLVVINCEILVLYCLVKRRTIWRSYLYIFILSTQFRLIWYGRRYDETAILLFIPIIYFVTHHLLVERVDQSNRFIESLA